jgi:hypothetical protein
MKFSLHTFLRFISSHIKLLFSARQSDFTFLVNASGFIAPGRSYSLDNTIFYAMPDYGGHFFELICYYDEDDEEVYCVPRED